MCVTVVVGVVVVVVVGVVGWGWWLGCVVGGCGWGVIWWRWWGVVVWCVTPRLVSLRVTYAAFSFGTMYDAFMETLAAPFEGTKPDTTGENLQARLRGVLLMSLSNKFGSLVLTTGNKSEMAVGYSTLYGDMAGGFDVLKDVPKTLVFRLAWYRNSVSQVIPDG